MSIETLEEQAAQMNAKIDEMKAQLRGICRDIDRARAEKKIADMPEAERDALLAIARGA